MDRSKLRGVLVEFFDEGELRDLCFDLGVDYDNLPGESKADKARELIGHCRRHNKLYDLLQAIYDVRPHAMWGLIVKEVIVNDARARTSSDTRPTVEIDRAKLPTGRTGPLRQQYHEAVLASVAQVNQRIDELGEMVRQLLDLAVSNRTLIVAALVLSLATLVGLVVVVLAGIMR